MSNWYARTLALRKVSSFLLDVATSRILYLNLSTCSTSCHFKFKQLRVDFFLYLFSENISNNNRRRASSISIKSLDYSLRFKRSSEHLLPCSSLCEKQKQKIKIWKPKWFSQHSGAIQEYRKGRINSKCSRIEAMWCWVRWKERSNEERGR